MTSSSSSTPPVDRTEPTPLDRALDLASFLVLVGLVVGTALAWWRLPQTVPTHLDWQGQPDGWGSRTTLLAFPAIGIVLWLGFGLLLRLGAHRYNYLVELTEQNAPDQYRLAKRLVRALRLQCLLTFSLLATELVRIALGLEGLGIWLLVVLLVPFVLIIAGYFVAAQRALSEAGPALR